MFLLYSRRMMGGGAVVALNRIPATGFWIETRLNKFWRGLEVGFAYIFSPTTWSITVHSREDRCISRRSDGLVDFTNFRLDSSFSMHRGFIRYEIEFVSTTGPFQFQFPNWKHFYLAIVRLGFDWIFGFSFRFLPWFTVGLWKKAEIKRRFRWSFFSLCFIELSEFINSWFRMSIEIKINFEKTYRNIRFISFW